MGSGMAMAMRAGGEFVAAILVGAAIGLGLDWALQHQAGVYDRVLSDRRRRRGLERDPGDFAKRGARRPQFELVWREAGR